MATLQQLLNRLNPGRYYVSEPAARGPEFNVLDLRAGTKVDVMFLRRRAFSASEFARRRQIPYSGRERWVASMEDVILAKLEWGAVSSSERQLRDVLGVIQVQRDRLDLGYLRHWANELGVAERLEELLAK